MNWPRGLIALWVLCSVLWVALVCTYEVSQWQSYWSQVASQRALRSECQQAKPRAWCPDWKTNLPSVPTLTPIAREQLFRG
jgi:hypothetical protein